MIKTIILLVLYFCITGLWLYIQVVNFDFSSCTKEQLDEVEDLFTQINQSVGWDKQQAMQCCGVLAFLLGWILTPVVIIRKIIKFFTKGLTK